MKFHVIEIFFVLHLYTSHGIPRFHHHNPQKKHSSHSRAKSTSARPQTDLCSGTTKQDVALIKQFYARTFALFRSEQPGCVCIQLCKGKPAYCYPDGCFHSLGGCSGRTTTSSKESGSKVPEIRERQSEKEAVQSRNSLSTQGDFNKKFQSKVNSQTGDQIKKRENDSFLTDNKDKDNSKEIPDVLVENYPSDLKIPKLIDKDYTQWPKSKILQDIPNANFSQWDLEELNADEISTVSNIASGNTTNFPYALSEGGRQVPSFIDFKQQFEMLSNSQQMPVFDDFFAETKKVITSNQPSAVTTPNDLHHQSVRESNEYYQKVEYATKEDMVKRLATGKPSGSTEGHLGNYIPNKRDFAENIKDLYASEAFSELYNNYIKRFDEPKILDDIGETKGNDPTLYRPHYLKPTSPKVGEMPNKKGGNFSNHKTIDDTTVDDDVYIEETQDNSNKAVSADGKISETDFNAIFHNYYGGNQTVQQIENNFIIPNNSHLSTPTTVLKSTTLTDMHTLRNKTDTNERISDIGEVINSGTAGHSATHRVATKHKPKFSYRGVLKSGPSHHEANRTTSSNHKGISNLPQVRFTNDFAQLKNRDARPTSQIYATLEKRPLQSEYQKERRSHQESKRQIRSSTEPSVKFTEIVTLVNRITGQPRNETHNKRKGNPHNKYFRKKRPGVSKNK